MDISFGEFSLTEAWIWIGRAIVAVFLIHFVRGIYRSWQKEMQISQNDHGAGPPVGTSGP